MLTIEKIAIIIKYKQWKLQKRKLNNNPYLEKPRDWPDEASATTYIM
jgi:hypothetical protein